MNITPVTLLELNLQIKKAVKENTESCWIVAEINELKVNYSGHCYLELIQKDEFSDQIIARSKATIWASHFRMIKPYFESTTRQPLIAGLSIMVKVSVEFHELYGISLNIIDIEPTYTVGELAIRRQKIIERLTEEGVVGMNKDLEFPYFCQKIAVISSATAAGFKDFADQLEKNTPGYKFYIRLFPAVMQGNEAEDSIIKALERVYEYEGFFDAVVIIRGGGSKTDLGCFDNYRVAYHVAQFPLPVITGIGHEQDDSVTDMVAHIRLKTPTAVAAFLIDKMTELEGELHVMQEQIIDIASSVINTNKEDIYHKIKDLQLSIHKSTANNQSKLLTIQHKLSDGAKNSIFRVLLQANKYTILVSHISKKIVAKEDVKIDGYKRQIGQLDPLALLKKGYSITKHNGKAITKKSEVSEGDMVETILYEGKIISQIKKM